VVVKGLLPGSARQDFLRILARKGLDPGDLDNRASVTASKLEYSSPSTPSLSFCGGLVGGGLGSGGSSGSGGHLI
jgi:hypothetical protein